MCIVLNGQDGVVEQARRQLEDLVPVWAVLDYTNTHVIRRELLLAKISILGPEYLEDQLTGGPSHEPRREEHHPRLVHQLSKLDQESHNFGDGKHQNQVTPLTASEALRRKHHHLHSISVLSSQFGAKIVDVSDHSVIVEMTAKTNRVEAFLSLIKPFGLLESARTGLIAMPRTPINRPDEEVDDSSELNGTVDASLLPPG
jgi:acetolactate synthase-1/3 small subunit